MCETLNNFMFLPSQSKYLLDSVIHNIDKIILIEFKSSLDINALIWRNFKLNLKQNKYFSRILDFSVE